MIIMLFNFFKCFIKSDNSRQKLKRENTPYPRMSVIDVDERTIDQVEIKSNYKKVDYEYLPYSSILHIYKKS